MARAFQIFALGFAISAAFHLVAVFMPGISAPSPVWRHLLFVGINGAAAAHMIRRPRWFPYAFALLCVQQLYSHGTYAWDSWEIFGRIDWASIVVLATMPTALVLLVMDARRSAA